MLSFQPTTGPMTSISGQQTLGLYSFFPPVPPSPQGAAAGPDAAPDGPLLSATLQAIAYELSSGEITSFEVAKAIATRHPEYASGRLAYAALQAQPGAAAHGWALWRDSVAQLYDRSLLRGRRDRCTRRSRRCGSPTAIRATWPPGRISSASRGTSAPCAR